MQLCKRADNKAHAEQVTRKERDADGSSKRGKIVTGTPISHDVPFVKNKK